MEENQNEKINISDTVAEITNVISKHLTKVIEQVSSKNNDASQNMEILNQLPIVKNLKLETDRLQQELRTLQEKYKSALEELVQFKSNDKITMEITELGTTTNNTVSMEEIVSSIQNKESSTPSLGLWGIGDSESDCDDAQPISSNSLLQITKNSESDKLRKESKNQDVSPEDERLAIDNWVNFHENTSNVDCTKSDNDILIDIMNSSAGIKGWAFKKAGKKQTTLTLNSFTVLDDNSESEEEVSEDEEDEEDEDDEEDDDEDDEDDEDEADEDEDDDNKEFSESNCTKIDTSAENNKLNKEEEAPIYLTGALIAQKNKTDIIDDGNSSENENDEEEEEEDDDEEVEVEELVIDGKTYYTDDSKNGSLFEYLEDGEIGDIVGHLENGSVFF